ncbi:hypothetical protein CYLTODRAFT_402190 [Cylindrobasidium torrendii FP15055 ss-10]|uniref:Uncharacterized protein n=1 Tax=Cylindrobasidium torrendii FP15055 ss-10 TaxID=1314674 RepID=A0A0D7B157_9AGAR|nr:hypothetical protein CYLTODRAFT_402190 [Cylindrobasidium torrendii FP15055 ss-10]
MAPRKPTWDWKARGSAEFEHFDVSFAAKEYNQNQVGQVLKEKNVRSWNGWKHQDLYDEDEEERDKVKKSLMAEFPALFSGPHGSSLRRPAWKPCYVLKAIIPHRELSRTEYKDDLKLCTVIWSAPAWKDAEEDTVMGLSFYNNHMDKSANFSTFVVDGASTSKNSIAVGEKGKGFILATQYLHECIEDHRESLTTIEKRTASGISFRVGNHVGTVGWKKTRAIYVDDDGEPEPPQLRATLDDLTPYTATQFAQNTDRNGPVKRMRPSDEDSDFDSDDDEEDEYRAEAVVVTPEQLQAAEKALRPLYKRRAKLHLSRTKPGKKDITSPDDEIPVATRDEVCITALGLPPMSPHEVFSAVYGIILPPKHWKVNDEFSFFLVPKGSAKKTRFYHRDQLIPFGFTSLNRLSINYHGSLKLASDRLTVLNDSTLYWEYASKLERAVEEGITKNAGLAKQIALDFLTERESYFTDGPTIAKSLQRALSSKSKADIDRNAYRTAVFAALRFLDPKIPAGKEILPYTNDSDRDQIVEQGMHPVKVNGIGKDIMQQAGVFEDIQAIVRKRFLAAPPLPQLMPGASVLMKGILHLFPTLKPEHIAFVDWSKATPVVEYDPNTKRVVIAPPPPCPSHAGTTCICFIGRYLRHVCLAKPGGATVQTDSDQYYRAFMHATGVDTVNFGKDTVSQPEKHAENGKGREQVNNAMDVDPKPASARSTAKVQARVPHVTPGPSKAATSNHASSVSKASTQPPLLRAAPAIVQTKTADANKDAALLFADDSDVEVLSDAPGQPLVQPSASSSTLPANPLTPPAQAIKRPAAPSALSTQASNARDKRLAAIQSALLEYDKDLLEEKEKESEELKRHIASMKADLKAEHGAVLQKDGELKKERKMVAEKETRIKELEDAVKRKDTEIEKLEIIIKQHEDYAARLDALGPPPAKRARVGQ